MKSRVAPTPIGTVRTAGWRSVRFEPLRRLRGDLGIEHDVEVGVAEAGDVGGAGAERRDDVDVDTEPLEQPGDLAHVVAMAEAERGRAEQVAARSLPSRTGRTRALRTRAGRPSARTIW